MKKYIAILLTISLSLIITGCSTGSSAKSSTETAGETVSEKSGDEVIPDIDDTEDIIGMPNPFTDCDTLEEAAKAAGFDMEAPEEIEDYPKRSSQVSAADKNDDYSLIQVLYQNEESGNEICIRKADSPEDISGDYNEYEEESVSKVNGCDVTMSGNSGEIYLAVWTDGDYGYSVGVYGEKGLTASDMTEIIKAVR